MNNINDMSYDTVIFDLDGTLLDTLDDLAASVNAALSASGLPVRNREEVRRFVGNGVVKLIDRAVPAGTASEEKEKVLEAFKKHYSAHSRDLTRPYPGIIELLDALAAGKVRMAIVSNKFQAAVEDLNTYYFADRIPVAAGENEAAGIRKKPAPDMVLSALQRLGAEAKRALYVGDSEVDAQTAEAAGMDYILVTWGFRERAVLQSFRPLMIADEPAQILLFLDRKTNTDNGE